MFNNIIFKKILEKNTNGFIIINLQRKVLYVNEKLEKLYGLTQNKILGNYLNCIYTANNLLKCQKTANCETCLINLKIEEVIQNGETQFLYDLTLGTTIADCTFYKIDNFIVIEFFNLNKSEQTKRYLSNILDKTHDLIFFKDSTLKYKYINKSGTIIFGRSKEDIYEKQDHELLPKDLYHQCINGDLITLEKGSYAGIETYNDRSFHVFKERVFDGILGIAKDITKEIENQYLAEIDSLTNLFNRRSFLKMIENIYHNKSSHYLILIDLDSLRDLNNNYGHLKGDEYLIKLASILSNYPECSFFRIGGDEFAGLINRNFNDVDNLLKGIFENLAELNLDPKLTISCGAKKINLEKNYLENYSKVDELLYQAKLNGKNCYILKS